MEFRGGELHVRGAVVTSTSLHDALAKFLAYLKSAGTKCLLVAHNSPFDTRFIMSAVRKCKLEGDFEGIVSGIADTQPLFKNCCEITSVLDNVKLINIARKFLDESNNATNAYFHDATFDVDCLEKLTKMFIPSEVDLLRTTLTIIRQIIHAEKLKAAKKGIARTLLPLRQQKVISEGMIQRLADHKISFDVLKQKFAAEGVQGLTNLLYAEAKEDKIFKKVTIVNKVIEYFEKSL